jgi:hypothetical protein
MNKRASLSNIRIDVFLRKWINSELLLCIRVRKTSCLWRLIGDELNNHIKIVMNFKRKGTR